MAVVLASIIATHVTVMFLASWLTDILAGEARFHGDADPRALVAKHLR